MEEFYVEFEERTKWYGLIKAESLDEAVEKANKFRREDVNNLISIHYPLDSVMLAVDRYEDGSLYQNTIDRMF